MPTRKDVPRVRPSASMVKHLQEDDKELWTKEDIKKEDERFGREAKGLMRFLKRFRRL